MKELPTWFDVGVAKDNGDDLTPLEQFIHEQEPAGLPGEQFREQLLAVINDI
jgi:hypothetical protein